MCARISAGANASHVLWCGDSNAATDDEAQVLTASTSAYPLVDAWPALYHRTPEDAARNPGITFDTELNPMTTAGKTIPSIHARTRLDRLFLSGKTIELQHMEIIGRDPIDRSRGLWPSDHYAVLFRVRLRSEPNLLLCCLIGCAVSVLLFWFCFCFCFCF